MIARLGTAALALALLAGCAGIPIPPRSVRTEAAARAHAAHVAAIIAAWESAGGSRVKRPSAGAEQTSVIPESTVSAAWWGFDASDATSSVQAAIDSGARTIVIPRMSSPWTVSRTVDLRWGGMQILLEPGVVLQAAEGAFRAPDEPLVSCVGGSDFSLVGYGATLRMRKQDYERPPYEPAEWRHAISLRAVQHALVAGVSIDDAGGDGVYVGTAFHEKPCQDLTLRDLDISNSYRQGITVTSAARLLVDECRIRGSRGALPMAGIDFEPNSRDPGFTDCTVRRCWIESNRGVGILLVLKNLTAGSAPVSIRVRECTVDNLPIAIWLRGLQNRVRGMLTIDDCSVRGLQLLRGSSRFSVVSGNHR
ncbi:MAG TPA: right-handed parallel beta-helix repeat-containing protein [Candidatus Sulfotelmatobacter sp.]|nr:right-handed parallel beta-helix repeat-containing protein [Candidatus Sulfotelmatobacter sp.]